LVRSPVQKLLFHPLDSTKVVGVEYLDHNHESHRAFATQNVVLSTWNFDAGILQQSGIGPTTVLSDAGITPRIINEHVGKNWKTHTIVPLAFLYPNMTGVGNPEDGPWQPGFGNAFVADPITGTPTQRGYHLIPVSYPFVLAMFTFHLRAQSNGEISVYTNDAQQIPKFDTNWYGDFSDILSWRNFLRTTIPALLASDPNIISLSIDNTTLFDDSLFDQWLIDNTLDISTTHNFGTTRLSTSAATGVIDIDFKVHGAKNLRVCDCSSFPFPVDGNPSYAASGLGQICALSILGLPVPAGAKKKSEPKPKTFSKPPKRDVPPRKRSMTNRQMYDAIVNYFNQIRTTNPGQADQIIGQIQKNEPWKSLEAQFGPYVPSPPLTKKKQH
jgi:choline dehydrogenase